MNFVVRANLSEPGQIGVGHHAHASANSDPPIDDDVGSNFGMGVNLCFSIDNGSGVDAHRFLEMVQVVQTVCLRSVQTLPRGLSLGSSQHEVEQTVNLRVTSDLSMLISSLKLFVAVVIFVFA